MEIEFVIAAPPGMRAQDLEKVDVLGRAYARNAVQVAPAESVAAWWCARFGVARQADWPAAPFRLGAGEAGADCWLCADPVHLQFERDRLLFDPRALDDLREDEGAALIAMLNAHFGADGLHFVAAGPREWLLRVPRALDLAVPAPLEAHGLPAAHSLPQGADAAWARRLSNEAQMLLHQAPVNHGRQERRQWPVNSLWFWGGGTRPQPGVAGASVVSAQRDTMIFSDVKYVRGLAEAAGMKSALLPGAWPPDEPGTAAKALIDLTEISWRADGLAHLQANWLEPAGISSKAKKLTFFCTLLIDGRSFRTKLYRSDLFHFFCRKSLAHYVDNIQNQAHT
jgi:hypothetical protein